MKRTVQTYTSYEATNDAQITLLAAGVNCTVKRHAQDIREISEAKNERYGVEVEDIHYEQSKDLLGHPVFEDCDPLIQCPFCTST